MLLFLGHTFERFRIGFLIQKTPGFGIPLHPMLRMRVIGLRTLTNGADAVMVAIGWIFLP